MFSAWRRGGGKLCRVATHGLWPRKRILVAGQYRPVADGEMVSAVRLRLLDHADHLFQTFASGRLAAWI